MKNKEQNNSQLILYQTEDGKIHIEVRLHREIYHKHRLSIESKQEALEDDKKLKRIQNKIEKKSRGK